MLPELTTPPGVPIFRANSNALQILPIYADVPMRTGSLRKRRIYTSSPKIVQVEWFLTDAQMAIVHSWFENDLVAGVLWFSARLISTSGRLQWFRVRWSEQFHESAVGNSNWVVSGKLLVDGVGSDEPPVVTTLGLEIAIPLVASARATVLTLLELEINVPLGTVIPLSLDIAVGLDASAEFVPPADADAVLREDSGYVLREDGFKFKRE